jgi:excisionase family DNA binding protein
VLAVLPLPKSSLYDLARYGRMPGVVRVGRRLLFDLDTLDDWIAAGGGRPQ